MEKREFEVKGIIAGGKQWYDMYYIPAESCANKICDFAFTGGCAETMCLEHACNKVLRVEILNEWKDMKEAEGGV